MFCFVEVFDCRMAIEFDFGFEDGGLTCNVKSASCSANVGSFIDAVVCFYGCAVELLMGVC